LVATHSSTRTVRVASRIRSATTGPSVLQDEAAEEQDTCC
jgi:hypothetical protein